MSGVFLPVHVCICMCAPVIIHILCMGFLQWYIHR